MPLRSILSRLAGLVMLGLASLLMVGCADEYGQDTPEQTIATAKMLVEKGQARKLGNLIYAENEDMRRLLNQMGVFMGNVQQLSASIELKFPEEMAELKARTEEAAKQGKATSLLTQMTAGMRQGGNRRNRAKQSVAQREQAEQAFNDALKRLFADPYAWIKESESRITTTYLTDDTTALLWDGKPILPPIGMVMKKDDEGKWFFLLPTNLPGAGSFMPKTKDEYFIWGKIIFTFNNVVVDLKKDIDSGSLTSLEGVAQRAGEKAFLPAAMVFMSLSSYKDAKARETKAAATAGTTVIDPK